MRGKALGRSSIESTGGKEMGSLKEVLDKIATVEGVEMALVAGRDGFIIEYSGGEGSVAEGVGAIASSSLGASEVIGAELGRGGLGAAMLEYEKGTVMMNRVGEDAVLMVVLAQNATIGKVRYDIRKTIPELSAAL
jgi:uncharacterized protein